MSEEELDKMIIYSIIKLKYPKGLSTSKKAIKKFTDQVNDIKISTRLSFLEEAGLIISQNDRFEPLIKNLSDSDVEYRMSLYYKSLTTKKIYDIIELNINQTI